MPILVLISEPTLPDPGLVGEFLKSKSSVFTDIGFVRDADGVYDLDVDDETNDLGLIDGLESALLVSLFSDRRATDDEIGDPLLRRGWIGDLVSEVPGDRHGSGLWLYDQRKLTSETIIGVRLECDRALRWMVDEGLVSGVTAAARSIPNKRTIDIQIAVGHPRGGQSSRTYAIALHTAERALTNRST